MTTCVLVGAVDFNAEHFRMRRDAGAYDFVIAVDAGFSSLEAIGVMPDMAVGDFDSLGYLPPCPRVSRHPVKKDKSDLELALDEAVSEGFDAVVVYGALSRRLDHTIANLQLFARYAEDGVRVTGVGDTFAVRLVTGPGSFDLPPREGGTVSVLSASATARGVVETGMLYSLDDEDLTDRTSRGVSNELTGEPANVAVREGTLYVFYPLP